MQYQLQVHNFKDIRHKLIDLQRELHNADLDQAELTEIKVLIQQIFDQIRILQEKDQEAFEKEADENNLHLKARLHACIEYIEENLNETEAAWQKLIDLQDDFRGRRMRSDERETLYSALQELFDIVKKRRKTAHDEILSKSAENKRFIEQRLENAAEQIENNSDFHQNWQLLLTIQQEFRDRPLDKSTREDLYTELQILFEALKARRSQEQEDFERSATEALNHLRPLVEQATRLAKTSREFKKTKGFLIRVQREFKGRRMRKEERESLFSKLQSAFDTLNRRINEHIAAKKDIREFKVDSKLSDLQTQVEELELDINKDIAELNLLKDKLEDLQVLDTLASSADKEQNRHQLQIMQAALKKKTIQLRDLQEEVQKLLAQKDWLDSIE